MSWKCKLICRWFWTVSWNGSSRHASNSGGEDTASGVQTLKGATLQWKYWPVTKVSLKLLYCPSPETSGSHLIRLTQASVMHIENASDIFTVPSRLTKCTALHRSSWIFLHFCHVGVTFFSLKPSVFTCWPLCYGPYSVESKGSFDLKRFCEPCLHLPAIWNTRRKYMKGKILAQGYDWLL
jgi:hypothetical protein